MAARFWVGGSGTWSTTNTTNWSATSGGAGGASVPGAADDVTIDGNSGSPTITTNYNASVISVTINASAATLSLGGTLTCSGSITLTAGTFTTNNNNVTAATFTSNNSNTRTITLGSSTVTLSGSGASTWQTTTTTNLTFNAGTSTIAFSNNAASITLAGGGLTFYNVSKSAAGINELGITGANTFNDLSVTGPASAGVVQLTFAAAQTINGTLSTTGTAGNRRVWFRSATYGGGQTLTVNAASLTDADFRDIYVIGAGAPISGTRIGNRGNNRGITFSTPKTVYWNLAGAQNWSADGWAPSSAGTPNTDNFPLPQDTAVFDNAGSVTGTITADGILPMSSVDMSARTNAMTLSTSTQNTVYGSWTNGSGTTITLAGELVFSGEGTKTITSAGKSFVGNINTDIYNGELHLADALTTGGNIVVTNGTFDTKNYNVTANTLSSTNSNFRTITLGSSTITLNNTLTFATSTNLTFNSGTSSIVFSASFSLSPSFGGQNFYDVSFTNASVQNVTISSPSNTFNNFSITAPSASTNGPRELRFDDNQIINGTLTVAGASAVNRIFVRSGNLGTSRTLTVGTLSATDCDFRDITIAGTAAGSSPTRAGDCGGNSGINFPAPKTVYWNLAGAQGWSATAWATSSGGSPAVDNFPLAQDTAVFDEAAGSVTDTITFQSFNIGTVDMSARTSAMTLTVASNSPKFYGNWLFGTGVTLNTTGGSIQFLGRGTSTITSNGVTFAPRVVIDCVTGTVQLADALSLDATQTLQLLSGTFDAVTYNVTTGKFVISAVSTTLKMGSGLWTLSGTATVWTAITGVNFNPGTANILLSDTSTTLRTFEGGGYPYNKLTIGGATGTSTTNITGTNFFAELASTKTVAHTVGLSSANTFGKWSITGTAGNVVTVSGSITTHILAGDATSGIDYLAMGSTGFDVTSPGEFYAGANSTGTAGAPVFRTATPAGRTLYWVGGTGNWNDTARWSLSSGGAGGEAVPRSMDNVIFDSASNATGYTATVNQITGGNRCKALTIAGPATGNLTLAGTVALIIHDDITLPAAGLTRTYTGSITLSSSQTGRTIISNGVALSSSVTVNGVGCEWALGDALTIGSTVQDLTIQSGSFDTANYNFSCASFRAQSTVLANKRTITLGSSTLTVSGNTFTLDETFFAGGIGSDVTFNAGTSQINLSNANATITSTNKTFYNVSFTSASTGTRSITSTNTFNNLSLTASATGLSQLQLNANQTVNGTFTCAGSSAIQRGFVFSNTFGTTRTITAATLSANDCDFRDITIAGVAAGTSPTRAGDCGGNSGITFPATKTVYWNLAGTQNWNATAWATTNNGTPAVDNFPLAQDTATFTDSGSAGTVQFGSTAYNFSSIDASTRTSAMTLSHNGSQTLYGSYTLGSGVTVSGTSGQTFSGRGTMTFTSAGKTITFPITVNAFGGTFQFGDATITSNTITHNHGTFNANNYNLTCTTFSSAAGNLRTITMGSGTWTLSGTGTVWNTSTGTNLLTLNANTSEILLSNTSTSARTFTGGGMSFNKLTIGGATGISVLSITGFNSFNELASTKTVAHTVRFTANQNAIGTWSVTGSSGNVVTVDSSSATTRRLMRLTNATSAIDYLNVQSIEIDAIDKFYAGANSTNVGNTLNVYFAAAPTPPPPVVSGGNMFLLFM